jgi:catechol 2,3-dioxygenase-like lactoylglutathione lyase family enzyme
MYVEFILYVKDQERSKRFYAALLDLPPSLDVPGMTEFILPGGAKLGLMPESGIARIISGPMPHPDTGRGIPRCELYLVVKDLAGSCAHAERIGARSVDPVSDRDWGHRVAYYADDDGHIIALARPLE